MRKNYINENEETQNASSGGMTNKLAFLLVGGGIGAIVALLFAPKTGRELRGDISDVTRKGYDKTLETAQQLKEQSGEYYEQLKQQAGDVYNRASDKFKGVSQEAENILEIDDTADQISSGVKKATETAKQTASQIGDAATQTGRSLNQSTPRSI